MANVSITPANVKIISASLFNGGIGGEALTQGQAIYQTGGKFYKSDANDGANNKSAVEGIVLTPCATDGTFLYALPGAIVDLGATLTVAEPLFLSATAGAICPLGDLIATDYITFLGIVKTTSTFLFQPVASNTKKL